MAAVLLTRRAAASCIAVYVPQCAIRASHSASLISERTIMHRTWNAQCARRASNRPERVNAENATNWTERMRAHENRSAVDQWMESMLPKNPKARFSMIAIVAFGMSVYVLGGLYKPMVLATIRDLKAFRDMLKRVGAGESSFKQEFDEYRRNELRRIRQEDNTYLPKQLLGDTIFKIEESQDDLDVPQKASDTRAASSKAT